MANIKSVSILQFYNKTLRKLLLNQLKLTNQPYLNLLFAYFFQIQRLSAESPTLTFILKSSSQKAVKMLTRSSQKESALKTPIKDSKSTRFIGSNQSSSTNPNKEKKMIDQRSVQKQLMKSKSAQFHKSIAQQQRQQKRRKARQTFQMEEIRKQIELLEEELSSSQKRNQFLSQILQKMEGYPNQSWKAPILHLLQSHLIYFKQNELYKWIENGIIDKLCETVDQRFTSQGLWSKSVELLENLILFQPQFFNHILQNEQPQGNFLRKVYLLTIQQNNQQVGISNCIKLITTIFKKNREDFLAVFDFKKLFNICIEWFQKILKKRKSVQKILCSVYRFLILLSQEISSFWNKFTVQMRQSTFKIIQLLNDSLDLNHSQYLHEEIFIIINNLIVHKNLNQNSVSQNIFRLNSSEFINVPLCKLMLSQEKIIQLIQRSSPEKIQTIIKFIVYLAKTTDRYQQNFSDVLLQFVTECKKTEGQRHSYQNDNQFSQKYQIINVFLGYLQIIYLDNLSAQKFIRSIIKFFKKFSQKKFEKITNKNTSVKSQNQSNDQFLI